MLNNRNKKKLRAKQLLFHNLKHRNDSFCSAIVTLSWAKNNDTSVYTNKQLNENKKFYNKSCSLKNNEIKNTNNCAHSSPQLTLRIFHKEVKVVAQSTSFMKIWWNTKLKVKKDFNTEEKVRVDKQNLPHADYSVQINSTPQVFVIRMMGN